jgi:hypothetical protein
MAYISCANKEIPWDIFRVVPKVQELAYHRFAVCKHLHSEMDCPDGPQIRKT